MKIIQNQNFKIFLFFILTLSFTAYSQSRYGSYPNSIKQFSKPFRVLSSTIDKNGNGVIEYTNLKNQVLRFRLYDHKVQPGFCLIAFEIYYYENNFLKKIESLDRNGKLIGCEVKLDGEAVTEFIIEKPDLYLKKKKIIDDAEGNIEMNDSNEKIIRTQLFDSNYKPIIKLKPLYISSKEYWEYNIRMSLP